MWKLLPRSLARRLTLAFVVLLAVLLSTAGLALEHERKISQTIDELTSLDLERLGLTAQINEKANDGARKLLVLLTAPRDMRISAYTEIDHAHRRLDSAMTQLARVIDGIEAQKALNKIVERLARYRAAYQEAADQIEADDLAGAQGTIAEKVDIELSMLIAATQEFERTERQQLNQRLEQLKTRLARDRAVLLVLSLFGGLLSIGLVAWVMRAVAAPLKAVARAAHQLGQGDFGHRLPEGSGDEVGDIAAAFNQLAGEVQQRESALTRAIDFDTLTGLPQRDRFITQHAGLVQAALHGEPRLVLACFDVERLKSINALLGFEAGDEAIVHIARRALAFCNLPQGVARVGGGTFSILLSLGAEDSPLQRAADFRAAMEHSATWRGHAMDLSVTVGLAICPEHGETMAQLLRRAEQALFEAKRRRVPIAPYSPSIEAARLGHLSLLSELQLAIGRGELVPFLQPKLCLRTGNVIGAEALVRWRHPERGLVPPIEFIPFAENTGRIVSITQCMLTQCVDLLAEHLPGIQIAVNVSTYDLRDPGFPETIQRLLSARGLSPDRLQIEVTESGLLDSGSEPIERLAALRALGVGVSIDDFGTGQSSLAYLQRLPASELKIDRSFVDAADRHPGRQQLLTAIVTLAHALGLSVTAEGAETQEELDLLKRIGCDSVQGYVISRPLPVPEFLARYAQQA